MAYVTTNPYLASFFLIVLLSLSITSYQDSTPYDVLKSYDLPVGLLPTGVSNYTLNNQTGEFTVALNSDCEFTVADKTVKYRSNFSGMISNDSLSKIEGISVQLQILIAKIWVNIVDVKKEGDTLKFSASVIGSKQFPVGSFNKSVCCGCSVGTGGGRI